MCVTVAAAAAGDEEVRVERCRRVGMNSLKKIHQAWNGLLLHAGRMQRPAKADELGRKARAEQSSSKKRKGRHRSLFRAENRR